MFIHPRVFCQCNVFLKRICRKCDNWNGLRICTLHTANHAGGFVAAHNRHHQIHQNTVYCFRFGCRKSVHSSLAVDRCYNLCPRFFQHKFYNLAVDFIVLDQKDAHTLNIAHIVRFFRRGRTSAPCLINAERKPDADNAPSADLAVHLDSPFHLVYQLFHDGHAKPDATIMRPRILMLLRKGFKNVFLKFFPDTNSGIFNHELKIRHTVLVCNFFDLYKYRTMRAVILEGIVDDIH